MVVPPRSHPQRFTEKSDPQTYSVGFYTILGVRTDKINERLMMKTYQKLKFQSNQLNQ